MKKIVCADGCRLYVMTATTTLAQLQRATIVIQLRSSVTKILAIAMAIAQTTMEMRIADQIVTMQNTTITLRPT